MGYTIKSQSLGKKYDALTKCSEGTLNSNDVSLLYSQQVAKYNKNEIQNLRDSKEIGEGSVMFKNRSF